MINARLFLTCCAVFAAACAATFAAAQGAGNGLSSAQLQKLHRLNLPVIAFSAVPAGFTVVKAEALPGGRSYRIVYASKKGESITLEVGQLAGRQVAAAATPAPKHGFLQRLFGGAKIPKVPGSGNKQTTGTSSEAEGQGTAAIVADSRVIGTVRFTPDGECLRGIADSSKAQVHGVQVRVSGCNFDDPDTLIGAYKSARRY